jgi:CMP-N,N'-diacetyllegionaminic acid synthase
MVNVQEAPANATAVILARGGSRGVPGKNAAMVAGKPCLTWTIEAALAARGVGEVALSTDDAALARIGRSAGIPVIDRPPELATDTARIDDAARHAVVALGTAAQRLVILYGNVPVRPAGLIDRALDTLSRTGCDSVQSYASVGKFHPWWTARVDPDSGVVRPWEGEVLNHGVFRRQDLPPAFVPDGGVIALTRRALFQEIPGVTPGPHAFFGADRRGVLNAEGDVIDVDTPADLVAADTALRRPHMVGPGSVAAPPESA